MATSMAEIDHDTEPEPPLTPAQAAKLLNVTYRTVFRLVGLEWVEYQGAGVRPIRRVTPESVRRLLAGRRGRS
jgi:hypothetical protein